MFLLGIEMRWVLAGEKNDITTSEEGRTGTPGGRARLRQMRDRRRNSTQPCHCQKAHAPIFEHALVRRPIPHTFALKRVHGTSTHCAGRRRIGAGGLGRMVSRGMKRNSAGHHTRDMHRTRLRRLQAGIDLRCRRLTPFRCIPFQRRSKGTCHGMCLEGGRGGKRSRREQKQKGRGR